jgi:hypothetical protein
MLNKSQLKIRILTMLNELKSMDNQAESIEKFASDLSDAVDEFVKTATVAATPVDVTAAAMSNSGGPVVAANNLESHIS